MKPRVQVWWMLTRQFCWHNSNVRQAEGGHRFRLRHLCRRRRGPSSINRLFSTQFSDRSARRRLSVWLGWLSKSGGARLSTNRVQGFWRQPSQGPFRWHRGLQAECGKQERLRGRTTTNLNRSCFWNLIRGRFPVESPGDRLNAEAQANPHLGSFS